LVSLAGPLVGVKPRGVLAMRPRRFQLLLRHAGVFFGLGGLAACAGCLLVRRRGLLLCGKPTGGRLIAVLRCDLATILKFPVTRSPSRRGDQCDHQHGDDCDDDDYCDCAHCGFLSTWPLTLV
jgi:hypothetical protein